MSEMCLLCRRPKWIDGARMNVYCAAEGSPLVGPSSNEIEDCRRTALLVAALVAPVVEAAEGILRSSVMDADESEAELNAAFIAYEAGLRRLDPSPLRRHACAGWPGCSSGTSTRWVDLGPVRRKGTTMKRSSDEIDRLMLALRQIVLADWPDGQSLTEQQVTDRLRAIAAEARLAAP
jgi:hypothetical protein